MKLFYILLSGCFCLWINSALAQDVLYDEKPEIVFVVRKAVVAEKALKKAKSQMILAPETKLIDGYLEAAVDQVPQFPGGDEAILDYIHENFKRPNCPGGCREGEVVLMYHVDTTGQVIYARVVRSLHPLLDGEAVRVLQSLPKFKPGFIGDRKVMVYRTIRIPFKNS